MEQRRQEWQPAEGALCRDSQQADTSSNEGYTAAPERQPSLLPWEADRRRDREA